MFHSDLRGAPSENTGQLWDLDPSQSRTTSAGVSGRTHFSLLLFFMMINDGLSEVVCVRNLRWLSESLRHNDLFFYASFTSMDGVTDWGRHLWASRHCFCWGFCNVPRQWADPSDRENCHRHKGDILARCLSLCFYNVAFRYKGYIYNNLKWNETFLFLRHTSHSHQQWSSNRNVQVVRAH